MPVKFACLHCQQKLSVTSQKIGSQVKCPKCKGVVTVPTEEEGAAMLEMRRAARKEQADDPLSEFVVYDDEMELDYETGGLKKSAGDDIPVDRDMVAVPRRLLYVQGVLLGVVALGAFIIGVVFGGFTRGPDSGPPADQPATLSGKLTYAMADNLVVPDVGSVVIVLPFDRKPDQKVAVDGLRPDEPPPGENHVGVAAIRALDGQYARADEHGEFRLRLPHPGHYHILFVSGNAKRNREDPVSTQTIGGGTRPRTAKERFFLWG